MNKGDTFILGNTKYTVVQIKTGYNNTPFAVCAFRGTDGVEDFYYTFPLTVCQRAKAGKPFKFDLGNYKV